MTKTDTSGMFGDKSKLNPIDHLLGTAYAWGGNPKEAAVYLNAAPTRNDGKTPYVLKVRDVPVDGFWSITVYNAKGFMEPNSLNANSVNGVTAKRDADGSITINFGGGSGAAAEARRRASGFSRAAAHGQVDRGPGAEAEGDED